MQFKHLIGAAVIALTTLTTLAHDFKAGAITIDHPYARSTVAGQPVGGGFMRFVNGGGADRLVSASAKVSKSVELHEMTMAGDVMKMRQVDAIELPAGQTVELKPGGYHVMFIGLKAPLKVGDRFPLTLTFEKAGAVTVDMMVMAPGAAHGMPH
jgi:copper(I)-binding protein